jgi:hypothetical protein
MALNDLSVVAEDDGMVTRIERIVYIEGYSVIELFTSLKNRKRALF